jgi:hypothetical protein
MYIQYLKIDYNFSNHIGTLGRQRGSVLVVHSGTIYDVLAYKHYTVNLTVVFYSIPFLLRP